MKKTLVISILAVMFATNLFATENADNPGCEKLASEERLAGKDVGQQDSGVRQDRPAVDGR